MDIPKQKQPKMRIKKTPIPALTQDNIEEVYTKNFSKIDLDDNNFNTFLFKKEELDGKIIAENEDKYNNLYPSLDDAEFNIKLSDLAYSHLDKLCNVIPVGFRMVMSFVTSKLIIGVKFTFILFIVKTL